MEDICTNIFYQRELARDSKSHNLRFSIDSMLKSATQPPNRKREQFENNSQKYDYIQKDILMIDHTNSRVSFTLVTNGLNTPTVKEQRNVAAEKLRK